MITNLDRSLWIGASDTHYVVSNHNSKTWKNWWAIKTGLLESKNFKNKYTQAGDCYERCILNAYGENVEFDKVLLVPEYALRVNLDGNTDKKIIEAKTYKAEKGFLDKRGTLWSHYYMQTQVEMFAWRQLFGELISMEIRFYALLEEDYQAAFRGTPLPIDPDRIKSEFIDYDEGFINALYLPRLKPLAEQLKALHGEVA